MVGGLRNVPPFYLILLFLQTTYSKRFTECAPFLSHLVVSAVVVRTSPSILKTPLSVLQTPPSVLQTPPAIPTTQIASYRRTITASLEHYQVDMPRRTTEAQARSQAYAQADAQA